MKIKLAGAFLLFCLSWLPQNSWATCATCTCSITQAQADNVAFGNYQPFSSGDIDVTGTIEVQCSLLLSLGGSIALKLSMGSSGSYTTRTMKSGSNSLNYNLYSDSSRTTIWGDGTGAPLVTRTIALGLLFVSFTNTVYARLPAGQTTAAVGDYSDTITLTVEW